MSHNRIKQTFLFSISLMILTLSSVIATQAHGYIVRSIPENRATLERPPTRLQYWFSESLEPAFSELKLRNQNGDILAEGGVDPDDDRLLAMQILPDLLTDGAYIVELRPAFASDGHVVAESRVFFVGEEIGGVTGEQASDQAVPLEVVWKTLLYLSTTVLFGAYTVYASVLVRAWGNAKYPSGLLPPRVMKRLYLIIWSMIALNLGANILALMQQTMVFFGVGIAQVISGGLWDVVRIGSRFGDMWHARLFFLLVVIIFQIIIQYYQHSAPKAVRSFMSANVWVVALIFGAQAVNSHGAGSLILPWIAVMMHWLHTIAVAFWLGGIVVLTLILPTALAPYDDTQRKQALSAVMRRMSYLIIGALAIVITTGIYNSSNWFYGVEDFASTYGTSLALKLILIGLLIYIGALHHIALRPQWLERLPFMRPMSQWASNFGTSMRVETILVLVALASASLLSSTPVPQPAFTEVEIDTPRAEQQVGDLTVQMSIAPGGVGVNTVDIVVREGEATRDDLDIQARFVAPVRDVRSPWLSAEAVVDGLYVSANDAIDEVGEWWALVDIETPDGMITRAAFTWDINEDANILNAQDPTLWNFIPLIAVILSIVYVMYPSAHALYLQLDLSPASVLTAVISLTISIILIIGAIVMIGDQQVQIAQQRNPTPDIVNTELPNQESLLLGRALYEENCIIMQSDGDFINLTRQINQLRDDVLYDVVSNGWRNVPPCNGELSTTERWHIVNYMRTLARSLTNSTN